MIARFNPSWHSTPIRLVHRLAMFLFVAYSGFHGWADEADGISEQEIHFFETHVRPLLVEHCYECHSKEFDEANGDLRLDSAAAIKRGGLSGSPVVSGKPEQSLLMEVVRYESEMQMPPEGKLSDEDIAIFEQWVARGAPDPRTDEDDEPEKTSPLDRDPQEHWTFNPPKPANTVPPISLEAKDVLDAFAIDAASKHRVPINDRADEETLVRRLHYDLTGLPPSHSDLERYVASKRRNKYERLVDSLLASPEFGERFARHWLDVARYADTVGYAFKGKERRYKGSHLYRDWVIQAFARDIPYDEMVMHQLAGDRTDPENLHGNLDAMGFLTLGRKFMKPLDRTDDQIDVITRGLLGLTVSCARCHDHKFDPIPTADYYALFGVLKSSVQPDDGPSPLMMKDIAKPQDRRVLLRGQPGNHGPVAPRQFLTSLRRDDSRFTDGSGRFELAKEITRSDNPMFARVMVNRIWGWLIGKPLVDSPSDFGFRTERPAIPEILDELAVDFSRDWSIKRLIRRIVMTQIYQRSSLADPSTVNADPENDFLARGNRRRRDFESLRDSLLFVAQWMDHRVGGEPVEIDLETLAARRTLYAMIDRQNLPTLFRTFDFPDPNTHCPQRYFTTVPQQALFLINSPQLIKLAKLTAEQARQSSNGDRTDDPIASLFRQILGRVPTKHEQKQSREFLAAKAEPLDPRDHPEDTWEYGIAQLDQDGGVANFTRMSVFDGRKWTPTKKYPAGGKFGHASLGKENGHAPSDSSLAVVRRFTSPADGVVFINGQVRHVQNKGDGIRLDVFIGSERIHRSDEKNSNTPFEVLQSPIKAGQSVDFVVSNRTNPHFDSFFLRATLKIKQDDQSIFETHSTKHFVGSDDHPPRIPMDRFAQLAQVLLISNEFAFVD